MMSENPKLSIIVPVYNVEKYLPLCIQSILLQTYTDFEVLLIDDGSTDSSGMLCDSFKERDLRIRVFHKKNGGLSDARNYGIEHSHGEYLLFIDSDDALHPDFCRTLVELQNRYNADIVSSDLVMFYDSEQIEEFNQKKYEKHISVFYDFEILQEYFNPHDEKKTRIYHGLCMKLYRASLFKELRFSVGKLHEDLYITYKLLDLAHCFVFVDVPWYYYFRGNCNSITKTYSSKNFIDEYAAIQEMLTYFRGKQKVEKILRIFLFSHYFYLMYKYYLLESKKEVKPLASEMKKYLKEYLAEKNSLSFSKKMKYKTRLMFPRLFVVYTQLRYGQQ